MDSRLEVAIGRCERATRWAQQGLLINPMYVSLVAGELPPDYEEGTGTPTGSYSDSEGIMNPVIWEDGEWVHIYPGNGVVTKDYLGTIEMKLISENYTVTEEDKGVLLVAIQPLTITIPNTVTTVGHSFMVTKTTNGLVSVVSGNGVSMNPSSGTSVPERWAFVTVFMYRPNSWVVRREATGIEEAVWGGIVGNVTEQTDLVDYIKNSIQASNVGPGVGPYNGKSQSGVLRFRGLRGNNGVTVTDSGDSILLGVSGGIDRLVRSDVTDGRSSPVTSQPKITNIIMLTESEFNSLDNANNLRNDTMYVIV